MEGVQLGPVLAKIQWKDKEYYVRQKRITIGRHSSKGEVDVDLGNSNFISRVHLEIVYEEPDFLLKCNGKNGIFVDDDFQRPSDGLQILPSKCLIGFPSTGMFLVFSAVVGESPAQQSAGWPASTAARLALSPAATISADGSRPVSPARSAEAEAVSGEVTIISSCDAGRPGPRASGAPLLHHGYSSGTAQRRATAQQAPVEDEGCEEDRTKPPFSYAQLIVQAISSARDRQLTLSGIYSYITRHYPYYRTADKGWQNSIRHNLSLNRSFVKVARGQQQPGKGSFWRVEPQSEAKLTEQAFSRRRRAGANRERTGGADLSPDSSSHWTPDGATPPYLESREASPAPAPTLAPAPAPAIGTRLVPLAGSYNSGVAATVIVTPGRSGEVARARLVPLITSVSSRESGEDIIINPSDITFLSDECLIPTDPAGVTVPVLSSGASAGPRPQQWPPAAERC